MWRFNPVQRGKTVGIRIEPTLSSNDGEVTHAWALAGAGLIMRSEWDVADDLRAGRLVRVLNDWNLPSANIVALLGARHGGSARTARFLEHLHAMLTPVPWRQNPGRNRNVGRALAKPFSGPLAVTNASASKMESFSVVELLAG
jgi:hypothetical protein